MLKCAFQKDNFDGGTKDILEGDFKVSHNHPRQEGRRAYSDVGGNEKKKKSDVFKTLHG